MLELHQFLHVQYGICLWTLLAILVFLIMIVIWILHLYRQNKRKHIAETKPGKTAEEAAGNQ
ncbi:MAG: hypothetical protein ACOX4R_03455 [Lentihominibacter sp.]